MPDEQKTKKKKKLNLHLGGIFVFPISPWNQFRHLMIAGMVILVLLVGFHLYLFHAIESNTLFGTATVTQSPEPTVDQSKLSSVLAHFKDKDADRAKAPDLVPTVADPSK